MNDPIIRMLDACRLAEKQQALFYRSLAAAAEDLGDEGLSERFQQLHADEQHHLSRLTARLMELGHRAADPGDQRPEVPALDAWQAAARARERAEIERYEQLLAQPLDEPTAALAEQILETERAHERELGGKWMPA